MIHYPSIFNQLNIVSYLVGQVPGGIVLSQGATVKITLLEVYRLSYNGWLEIEFHGVDNVVLLNQLLWRKGKLFKTIFISL